MPHDSDQPRTRIQQLRKSWNLFRRDFVDYMRGVIEETHRAGRDDRFVNPITGEVFETPEAFLHYVRVLEWTPGADGLGHPHLHLWIVSPYLDRERVSALWDLAVSKVLGRAVECVVDIRKARQDVAAELVKYLTKDLSDTEKGRFVPVEIYAQVWAELEGQRARQSSAGFGAFELEVMRVCECCGHETKRWRFWLESTVEESWTSTPGVVPAMIPPGDRGPPRTSYQRWLDRRDRSWEDDAWLDLRLLRARLGTGRKQCQTRTDPQCRLPL